MTVGEQVMTVEEWKRKNPPIRRKPIANADRIRAERSRRWSLNLAHSAGERRIWKKVTERLSMAKQQK